MYTSWFQRFPSKNYVFFSLLKAIVYYLNCMNTFNLLKAIDFVLKIILITVHRFVLKMNIL